ncbi:MAG: lysozyme [Pseudomonadota bacterium]
MSNKVTAKVAAELIAHEGLVREAYKDSVGIWTWGIGVTSASGHKVYPRYVDNPQSLKRCFEVFEWLLRQKYVPPVEAAFRGHPLSEAQFGAAVSFHYNTGGIGRATWVKEFKAGNIAKAQATIMNWSKPPEIAKRRAKERDLFFDGKWSNDGTATEYPVKKPSYAPDFARGKRIDIAAVLEELFG